MLRICTLVLSLLTISSPAWAQSVPMLLLSDCASTAAVRDYVQATDEIPFVGGPGMMQQADQQFADGVWKIYMNPQTETYTIVIEFPWDHVACVVGIGAGLAPFEEKAAL